MRKPYITDYVPIKERAQHLQDTARSALEGAIADGTIDVGLYLRIARQDETPKIVRVESVSATINGIGNKILNVYPRILEEDGTSIDWLKSSSSTVFLDQSVAVFPPAVLESLRSETSLAGAESTIEPQPPSVREPEKILPPITSG